MKKIKIDANSPEGNAFSIIGVVHRVVKELGMSNEDWKRIQEDMTSGDYNHLCEVAEKETKGLVVITNRKKERK